VNNMKLIGGVLVVAAACTSYDEVREGEVEQAGTTSQGTTSQGTTSQGTTSQGTTSQGTTSQGGSYGGVAITSGSVNGTALVIWRYVPKNIAYPWEQRYPDKICHWNSTKTSVYCTPVDLATAPSPLAGTIFPSTFTLTDGSTVQLQLRIGSGTTDLGAVSKDSSTAMYKISSASGGLDQRDSTCGIPGGCTLNSDLWLYDVDVLDPDGSVYPLCAGNARAYAVRGTWDATATVADSPVSGTKFTFACGGGTIAKCIRWGYRPWTSARTANVLYPNTTGSSVALAPFHQACVRAAMADYCGNAHSFTTDGTIIDINDYQPHQAYSTGLIPRTLSFHYTDADPPTAFEPESEFDIYGATVLDFTRHDELLSLNSPDDVCPDRFSWPTAPMDGDPNEIHRPYTRKSPDAVGPVVHVDSTPACAHGEQTTGKFLHHQCSGCTKALFESGDPNLEHCTRGGGEWDERCIAASAALCSTSQASPVATMTRHGECTAGPGLSLYDTGCTIAVCGNPAYASCCTPAGWTASCVTAASSLCRGGDESIVTGFCGVSNGSSL
jgi:hypothetical protein